MLRFLLKRKIIIGLGIVFIFITGLYGMKQLDKELFPDVSFNQTLVMLQTEEMPAEDVEEFVTIPVEHTLDQIDGVVSYESSSSIGNSTTLVELKESGADDITKEIESNIAEMKEELYGVIDATVVQASTNNEFEMYLDISGASDAKLAHLAEEIVQPRLEALPEVGKVELLGLKKTQIDIIPKEKKLAEYDLQVQDMISAIEQANQSATLGILDNEKDAPSIRMQSSIQQLDDLRNLQIQTAGKTIHLADIANIKLENKEKTVNAWKNGNADFLIVQIGRASDVGQIALTDAVRAELENIEKEVQHPGTIHEIAAQGDYIGQAIDGIIENIIIGGIIAIIILLLFLRNVRATIIIGLSIPASILLTILTMTFLGYSFNLLSLIGLGLGIGMLVDASIVVLESIFKKKELGYNKLDAVLIGTKEVAGAVIASMLTTIVVFVPIVLLDQEIGKMIFILTAVIAITLISSVIIAFTLIPVLSENFLKVKQRGKSKLQITEKYGNLLKWLSQKKRRRIGILTLFLFMFIGSFFLISKIPSSFMPDILNRYAEVAVELEPGTTPKQREEVVKEINAELSEIPDIESNVILDNVDILAVLINMTPEEEKTLEQKEVNKQIFEKLRALEDKTAISNVASMMDDAGGNQVQIHVKGDDMAKLEEIGGELVVELEQMNEIDSANIEMGHTQNSLNLEVDEEKAQEDELTTTFIQNKVTSLFMEQNIGNVVMDKENIPMIVKQDTSIHHKKTLLEQKIPTANGEKPLSTYISLKDDKTFTQIDRENGERFITIEADAEGADLGALHQHINKVLSDFEMADGYSAEVAGDMKEQQQAATELVIIFAISLFLVFVVMAIQLNSLTFPFIILCIIPVTITGVILGLFITQKELNILSAIGVIMLIGIVINNGILLIDRARQLRTQGYKGHDAIISAGKERIRPIFMTTLTTVGGMLPLALATGASSDYQSPLAVVIISGLTFSTLITLILIPALYLLLEDMSIGIGKIFKKKKPVNGEKKTEEARLSS